MPPSIKPKPPKGGGQGYETVMSVIRRFGARMSEF